MASDHWSAERSLSEVMWKRWRRAVVGKAVDKNDRARLAHDSVLAISTWSLSRLTIKVNKVAI
jgi:hypothetical protein